MKPAAASTLIKTNPTLAPVHLPPKSTQAQTPQSQTNPTMSSTREQQQQQQRTETIELEPHPTITTTISSSSSTSTTTISQYPTTPNLILITLGLSLSIFLAALDSTIIAQAIPSLTDQFGTIANIAWYGTAYIITNTAFQSAWAKAYNYYALRSVYLCAIGVFEVGNLICGAAQSSNAIILGRIVAGVGGGGIMTGSFIIIAMTVRPQYRPAYMGVLGVTFGCASVVGPLLGGLLVELNWRWVFLINLPIGAVAAGIMTLFFSQPRGAVIQQASLAKKVINMDLNGGTLIAGALSCYVMAMHYSGTKPWSSVQVIGSLSGFASLTVLFILNEKIMGSKAMIQSHLLKKFNILTNSLFATFVAGMYFPLLYTLPIEFQAVRNDSASQSGVRLIPLVLGISVFTLLSNVILTWWRYYSVFLLVGGIAGTAGLSMIYTLDANASMVTWTGFLLLTAIGIGLSLQIPMIANQAVVGTEDIPAATSLSLFMENIGTALFVAAGVTQLRSRFPPSELPAILESYMKGCQVSHIISVACGSAATLLAVISASPGAKQGLQNWLRKSHQR